MTDKKETPNDTVDWAERLKASMSATPGEVSASDAPTAGGDDDLAALLRAQLSMGGQDIQTSILDLDTSEFEEEADEPDPTFFDESFEEEEIEEVEEAEKEAEEEVEEEVEEEEEISAELLWEEDEPVDEFDEDDTPDTLPEPETIVVYHAEEDEDALFDEPVVEEDTPTDLPWEDDEDDTPDTLPEPETIVVYHAEEDEDALSDEPVVEEDTPTDLPWEDEEDDTPDTLPEPETIVVYHAEDDEDVEEDEPTEELVAEVAAPAEETDTSPAPEYPPLRRYTIEPVPYDEEELISPDGIIGDIRLMIAREESEQLLEAMEYTQEPSAGHRSEETTGDDPLSAEASSGLDADRKSEPVRQASFDDPLQLGLDDMLPDVDGQAAMEEDRADTESQDVEKPEEAPVPQDTDYTRRMARHARNREETVRDAELYLKLGYERQLTRSEQQEAVEEARRRARERRAGSARNETRPVGGRREFTDRQQTPNIERAYTRSRRLAFTRLCVALVGALFCVFHDLMGIVPMTAGTQAYADTHVYPIVSVLMTILVCLPFLSRLMQGLASLFAFEPTRYAVSGLALIVSVLHGLLSAFTKGSPLYGGVALFMLAVSAATEYVATVAEETAFSVVSAGKTSYVLTDETTPASVICSETDTDEQVLTAVRTGRVSDFFARTGRYNPYMGRLNYLLPVALLVAIFCAGLSILQNDGFFSVVLPVFTATYLICLPAAYLVSMSLPLLAANRLLHRKGSTVLGTAAPTDICKKGSTRLLFRDGDAVGGLFRKEITLRDDPKVDVWRRKASCLFHILQCPLWKESPLADDMPEGLCVEVAETEEGYVRLFLINLESNESSEVMMGSREALTRRGIRLPKASMEQVYKNTQESSVIYLAFDGVFRIAYAVEYRLGATFAEVVGALASLGDTAGLITYDSLVGKRLLRVEPLRDQPPVEILRPTYAEQIRKSCSACVVATGRSMDLLYPYAACHRMKWVYRLSLLLSWLTILAAMGLSLAAVLTHNPMLLSSAVVTAWQILFTGASVAITLLHITRQSLFLSSGKSKKRSAGYAKSHHTPAPAETKTD